MLTIIIDIMLPGIGGASVNRAPKIVIHYLPEEECEHTKDRSFPHRVPYFFQDPSNDKHIHHGENYSNHEVHEPALQYWKTEHRA